MKPIQHVSFFALLALSAAACSAGNSAAADQAGASGQNPAPFAEAKADAAQASSGNATKGAAVQKAPASAGEVINGIAIMPGVERLSYISPRYYGIRESYDACFTQAQGAVPAQGECADEEFAYQDARLNKAYRALLSTLETSKDEAKPAAAPVQEAQRAWLAFYQKDCAVRAARFGSTAAPSTESICRMESVARRAQELEDWRGDYAGNRAQ
ncbi:lysozyme inhibitor LprI family protein [Luteimonas panaciterrae]|uniref:lysozyme inhibitor LprI family protein n=1 Tax=Luteimonas panaciterrae TaxID=363885 RepID=UPI001CF9E19E|nr:lysozyme inhibitor LprI family protein [Luteimonas panaciterrae]